MIRLLSANAAAGLLPAFEDARPRDAAVDETPAATSDGDGSGPGLFARVASLAGAIAWRPLRPADGEAR